LYELLAERTPEQSISHKSMPTPEEHRLFVLSRPYKAWYLIRDRGTAGMHTVGCCYLSKQNEIGISIYRDSRGNGYAKKALKLLMETHKGPYLANINPKNEASINLFTKLGFKLLQVTYEKA